MNILVLNCCSSSAKYKLIEIKENKTLAEGGVEKIGLPDGFIKLKFVLKKSVCPTDSSNSNLTTAARRTSTWASPTTKAPSRPSSMPSLTPSTVASRT